MLEQFEIHEDADGTWVSHSETKALLDQHRRQSAGGRIGIAKAREKLADLRRKKKITALENQRNSSGYENQSMPQVGKPAPEYEPVPE